MTQAARRGAAPQITTGVGQAPQGGAGSLSNGADSEQETVGRLPSATRWDALREKWGIEVVGEFCVAWDDKGTYFTTLMSGGPKAEGDRLPALFASEDLAWEAYERALLEWLGETRRVNVRHTPECDSETYIQSLPVTTYHGSTNLTSVHIEDFRYEFWNVYSRLSKVPA